MLGTEDAPRRVCLHVGLVPHRKQSSVYVSNLVFTVGGVRAIFKANLGSGSAAY